MIKHSVFMFLAGWVLWFITDKHPAALGAMLPAESPDLLRNFQLGFDMMKAGYLKAAFVFLWQAHYIVLSLIAGLMSSMIVQAVANTLRRRKLRELMRPTAAASSKTEPDEQ